MERYTDVYTTFNDDVQGTGAVIVALRTDVELESTLGERLGAAVGGDGQERVCIGGLGEGVINSIVVEELCGVGVDVGCGRVEEGEGWLEGRAEDAYVRAQVGRGR